MIDKAEAIRFALKKCLARVAYLEKQVESPSGALLHGDPSYYQRELEKEKRNLADWERQVKELD